MTGDIEGNKYHTQSLVGNIATSSGKLDKDQLDKAKKFKELVGEGEE